MFSPLEAKLYSVQVAINIHGGETALVTFEGCSSFQNQLLCKHGPPCAGCSRPLRRSCTRCKWPSTSTAGRPHSSFSKVVLHFKIKLLCKHGPPALDVLAPGGEAVLGASGHQHLRRGDRTRHFRRLFFISKSNYFVTTAPLRWLFSPLEAKLYSVQVAINIHGGETALVTFEGCSSFQNQITL